MKDQIKSMVYIPSRGRSDNCMTANLMLEAGINFKIVIEPQDLEAYSKIYDRENLIVMDRDNMGIAYVRNFCRDYSIDNKEEYHWQIDDNIKSFRIRENSKNVVKCPTEVLSPLEYFLDEHINVSMACLRHVMFAWTQKKELSYNQCMYSAFITKNSVDARFKDETIEDADFTLRILMRGGCTVIFNRLLMEKMTTGKMKGGNTEISHSGDGRLIRAEQLCRDWKGGFDIVYKNGVPKVRPLRLWGEKRRFKCIPIPK